MEPRWLRVGAIIVAVITAGSAYGVYNYFSTGQHAGCNLTSTNPLIFDQAEKAHTLDPQYAFSTPDWGVVQQVYQSLVMYNHSSTTDFTGVLAKNWSHSANLLHWNFTLWPNIHFSNGDPLNAYVMWFSLYRTISMYGADQYLLDENFWLPNVSYYSPSAAINAAEGSLLWDLNNFNFFQPIGNQTQVMAAPNQSFRALDPVTIQLNLGFGYIDFGAPVGYHYLLAEISSVGADAVDPAVVVAHGGVSKSVNLYLQNNMVGSGPYLLDSWSPGNSISFKPDPSYWATSLAAQETWNNNIQPAKDSIVLSFQEDPSINIQNLKTGAVAGASFAYIGPGLVNALRSTPCVTVTPLSLAYAVANGGWWIYMNQSQAPFNNWSVRAAVAHAINVSQIIQVAFGGWAYPWVGPVPPGYQGYNPGNLSPYQYNLAIAKQYMQQSPWKTGFPGTLNFVYVGPNPDWTTAALLIQQDLAAIGIKINPVPLDLNTYYTLQSVDLSTGQCTAQESLGGGPFPIGLEFYSSDWISPDDWTLNNVWSFGSANTCMGGYANATMDALAITAAGENNLTRLNQDYATMTSTMYWNYTDVWLAVPTLFGVYNNRIQGLVPNPIGSALPDWNLNFNTEYAA